MRRKEKEVTDSSEIEEILKTNTVCRIGLSQGNVPYIVPMNYGYAEGCLYLHSAREGRKIDILSENAAVCFEITDTLSLKEAEKPCLYSTRYRSVIGWGHAQFLTGLGEKVAALNIIMAQQTGKTPWEMAEQAVDMVAVLKIPIESISCKKSF